MKSEMRNQWRNESEEINNVMWRNQYVKSMKMGIMSMK
jgi:hypothetical protein